MQTAATCSLTCMHALMPDDAVVSLLARPIGAHQTIASAGEQSQISITQELLITCCERQLLEVDIFAVRFKRLGMKATLLCGCHNALQYSRCTSD